MLNYFLLILMTLLGSVAAIYLKKATIANKYINIFIGGFLYFVSALINIYVLKTMDYSVVLPFTSVTYIWTAVISYYAFGENMNLKKYLGIASILFGTVLISME